VWAAIVITIAAVVDPVFVIPAVVWAAGLVGLTYRPELGFHAVAVGNIVVVATVVADTVRAGRSRGGSSADARDAPSPATDAEGDV